MSIFISDVTMKFCLLDRCTIILNCFYQFPEKEMSVLFPKFCNDSLYSVVLPTAMSNV